MKKISVIIPCYNTEVYLPACLYSVLNQSYKNLEVIAVDDKSTDNTYAILKEYQKRYPKKLQVLQNSQNCGAAFSRNRGMKEATGDYIGFVDSDDVIAYQMYSDLYKAIKRHDALISECACEIIHSEEFISPTKIEKRNCTTVNNISMRNYKHHLLNCSPSPCNKLFQREILHDYTFLEYHIFEDRSFTFPLLLKAGEVPHINPTGYLYRDNNIGVSWSQRFPNEKILDIFEIYQNAMANAEKLKLTNVQIEALKTRLMSSTLFLLQTIANWNGIMQKELITLFIQIGSYKMGEPIEFQDIYTGKVYDNIPSIKADELKQKEEEFKKRIRIKNEKQA